MKGEDRGGRVVVVVVVDDISRICVGTRATDRQ